jgi:hypothetical protein
MNDGIDSKEKKPFLFLFQTTSITEGNAIKKLSKIFTKVHNYSCNARTFNEFKTNLVFFKYCNTFFLLKIVRPP